jgi:hypothetical protein
MKLKEIAKIVRSKNAGPFYVTIDILFESLENYNKVKDSKVLTSELVSMLYRIPVEKIRYFASDAARAFKFTFPRTHPSGDLKDSDIYGAQQHAPFLDIEVEK